MATFSTFQVVNNGTPQSAIVADPRSTNIYSVAYPPSNTPYLQMADVKAPAKKGVIAAAVTAAARG